MTTPSDSHDQAQDHASSPVDPNLTHAEEDNHQQRNSQSDPHSRPQSPKTLTLETPDPHTSHPTNHYQKGEQAQEDVSLDEVQIQDNPETLTPFVPPVEELHIATATAATAAPRRGGSKRKGQKRRLGQKKSQKKFEVLIETLKPIPFMPMKALNFPSHEKLLKRLGLWDFVHIEFDRNIRVDLIAQLIANYDRRYSYVNGARIMVNRADLARALKLPARKDRSTVLDNPVEELESEESKGFMEDFVSNWLLLHEDTWMMPEEVLNWTKAIKDGHFERLDWASMIWFMVEKELMATPPLGNCYYASHLQYLIKCQREDLLREEPEMEVDVKEEEEEEEYCCVDMKVVSVNDTGGAEMEDCCGDVKMGGVNESRGPEIEEHNIELSLGQENVVKGDAEEEQIGDQEGLNFEVHKDNEPGQWLLDGKNSLGEHFLQRCDYGDGEDMDCEEEGNQKGEGRVGEEGLEDGQEEEEEEGFHLSPKGESLEGLTSANLIAAMEVAQIPFSTGLQVHDNSSGEFLASRIDANMVPGGPSLFNNGNKRESGHENDISHHSLNGGSKRMRSDGPWSDNPSSEFDMCMDQIQHLVGRARLLHAAKERACEDSTMNHQIFIHEIQQRDNVIEELHKAKLEEQQRRQVEVYRLERELYVMGNLLDDYRKALKATQKAFADYRARCPLPEEPLYQDVKGSGGLVLSTTDLEKQRLKQEEEEKLTRLLIEKKINDFEQLWFGKFEAHKDRVQSLGDRLLDAENEVKLFKELMANRKTSENMECAPDGS